MTTDGGLRQIFQKNLRDADIVSIESWSTGRGVPDFNYCIDGHEGWVEAKLTAALAVRISPEQIGWIERRLRFGGRVTLAVRCISVAGPRKGAAVDALWLYDGSQVRAVADIGLRHQNRLGYWPGGPAKWNWSEIRAILTR